MMFRCKCIALLLVVSAGAGWAESAGKQFMGESCPLLFSLEYGERKIMGVFPPEWECERRGAESGSGGAEQVTTWTDSETGLEVRCDVVLHEDFRAVEWVLHLTNTGDQETPVLENVRVADFAWPVAGESGCELYYAEGSHERITDFRPMQKTLEPGAPVEFAPYGGRSSDGFLPFFNVAGSGRGIVVALGWTGQWSASFEREGGDVRVRAGLEQARFKLMPGESVRMPSVLLLWWDGDDRMVGQNRFRRLLLERYVPRYEGAPVKPLIAASPHAAVGFEKTTETNMVEAIRNIAAHGLPVDYFWIDAGWYAMPGESWATGVGNFQPDPARFPRGLKLVADAAHEAGMKFLLWFEPERVMPETMLFKEHAEWLLKPGPDMPEAIQYQFKSQFHLLDLARPEAVSWLTETVAAMIGEIGIDAYRNDFNMYPSSYWRENEEPDREGIEEIKYVEGLYRYFDALRERYPELLIDTCASGGRRIDLEMLKRALILTRSDYLWDPIGQQCHTYGLAQWLPITGIGAADSDRYKCRSGYGSHFVLAVDYFSENQALWDAVEARLEEVKALAPMFRGDFHPLTSYSTENDAWMAWQYHEPERGAGIVQAFRREECAEDSICCVLHGLEPDSEYAVTNLNSHQTVQVSGGELLSTGLAVTISEKPGAAILSYAKAG